MWKKPQYVFLSKTIFHIPPSLCRLSLGTFFLVQTALTGQVMAKKECGICSFTIRARSLGKGRMHDQKDGRRYFSCTVTQQMHVKLS